jgi:hypothetical protein
LPGIDDGDGITRGGQSSGYRRFESAGGFDDDAFHLGQRRESCEQLAVTVGCVGETGDLAGGADVQVEELTADIQTDEGAHKKRPREEKTLEGRWD